MIRVGIGYDSHRFVEGRPLVLGGVTIPHPHGLAGHSDADAVAHALIDAMLGAAAAGDIGHLFPAMRSTLEDADSMELLRYGLRAGEVSPGGCPSQQADLTIITEQPPAWPLTFPQMAATHCPQLVGRTSPEIGEPQGEDQ